ncbi:MULTISPECIES: flagellar hook-basal body complex protein FliE [Idiomarina]|jgi:flagellar hook-basal body complex protein FliE|uniref:Flagellar hook-basal body complex protein FliE n=2 Tax=Idiomarina TaxID=135575 RepID=A0A432Z150_9GAMM|nr:MULTISPECIES: flagellar hook-basal body complex protein FliE [Idiomarina]KPD20884.1 flagellar hook-basal body protein FliE [Idiomarina abyssalis]MAO68440.1 flagellar hook-basal body complex protein FliE [Idiomarina sp.]MBF80716.1 flagellar hook-basal body complex protein FliE [Idiomarina sp.]MCK7459234.1 flagellar hook-basal body complex protein FliE [Idiomarina sp. ATCH4]RUO71622.1 flagellar hook-basal body complex protein FliE [Idiomarina ramblicola]|tara:strand:- start:21046 stop:21378 length:333 start_codon:yes stop_codon:yes gene_type:complete
MKVEANALYQQLQSMATQASQRDQPANVNALQGNTAQADFSNMLKNAMDNVNELQQTSGDLKTRMELGDPNVTLEQTMIASQKAGIAFEATVQVRNKVVDAYKEIMSMPV